MALTLATATTEVRDALNEDTVVFWTDAQIQKWIKEGCRIFSSKTLMVEASGDITLVANQLSYSSSDESFISTVIEPYAAIYANQSNKYKGLIKSNPRKLGNVATFTAGDPKYYCIHNRKVYIWPLTTAAIVTAGGLVTLLYAKYTEDIADIADDYQHLAVIYAVAKCKQKDQKFGEANALMAQFYAEVDFERRDKHAREEDTLDMFKTKARGGQRGAG
jgi:hypothetical protein